MAINIANLVAEESSVVVGLDGKVSLDSGAPSGSVGIGAANSIGTRQYDSAGETPGALTEFRLLMGGTLDANDVGRIFAALTTSGGPDGIVGVERVELLSVDSDSFSIALTYEGNAGATAIDRINFSGPGTEAVISAAASPLINVGNRASQFGIFDTDEKADGFRFFLGSIKQTTDLGDLGLSSYIMTRQVDDVFNALKAGAIDGVELIGGDQGDDAFALQLRGSAVKGVDTQDTVLITGDAADAAIDAYYDALM